MSYSCCLTAISSTSTIDIDASGKKPRAAQRAAQRHNGVDQRLIACSRVVARALQAYTSTAAANKSAEQKRLE